MARFFCNAAPGHGTALTHRRCAARSPCQLADFVAAWRWYWQWDWQTEPFPWPSPGGTPSRLGRSNGAIHEPCSVRSDIDWLLAGDKLQPFGIGGRDFGALSCFKPDRS